MCHYARALARGCGLEPAAWVGLQPGRQQHCAAPSVLCVHPANGSCAGTVSPRLSTIPLQSRHADFQVACCRGRCLVLCSYAGAGQKLGLARSLERSEEQTSELQSLMRISYAVFCLKQKRKLKELININ